MKPVTSPLRALAAALALGAIAVSGAHLSHVPTAFAASPSVGWLHTSGSKVLTSTNQEHTIKAANWFGLETSNCAPHGLWSISLDAGMAQIASFGFNTIRLPFSNECIRGAAVSGLDITRNPLLANKTPLQIMDIVIQRAEANGLSVILDRHRPSSAAQSELWYTPTYPESAWINDWTMLAKRYAASPTVIGADLHNEPHGTACWGCTDASRNWPAAATRAGNAVLAANPKLLIIIEGVERQANGESTWWGGGLSDVRAHPVSLAVGNRVVYSPHEYPASVYPQSWFAAANYPANLPAQWDKSWGYLHKQGIAPILVGEFGTKLETRSDQQWLESFVAYLQSNKIGFGYWSFNPNSGDTGGLVKDDWVTPQTAKLTALAPILVTAPPTTPTATPSPTATATPSPSTPPATTIPPAGAISAAWQLQSSWQQGYVAQVTIKAGSATRSGWTLKWSDANATSVVNAWGMTCSVTGQQVTCRGADWATHIPAGSSVTVGLQLNAAGGGPSNPLLAISSP